MTVLERGIGAITLTALAMGCFFYACTYDPMRHGDLRTPSGGSLIGSLFVSLFDQFAGRWAYRAGFFLGGGLFAALAVLLATGQL